MLDRTSSRYEQQPYDRAPDDGEFISLGDIWRFFIRHWHTIAACSALSLFIAIFYVITATPIFTARAQLLIETNIPDSFRQQMSQTFASLDAPQVETQLAIIRSERIAEKVARHLGLLDAPKPPPEPTSPSFVSTLQSMIRPSLDWIRSTLSWLNPSSGNSESASATYDPMRAAIGRVQSGLSVMREGYSYAINIYYQDPDPEAAAQFANAIANAYVEDRLDTRATTARQGSEWLEKRIDELRQQMNAAALAVQRFKAKRDYRIVGSNQGDGGSATGRGGVRDRNAATTGAAREAATDRETSASIDRSGGEGDARETRESARHTLEELESRADTYRKIYESYLQAYADSVQRQSYPVTNARVITPATRPTGKSHPRTKLALVLGLAFGAFAGLGIAFVLNSLDRKIRTSRQVRHELGLECLGKITHHEAAVPGLALARVKRKIGGLFGGLFRFSGEVKGDADVAYRLNEVVDLPFSRFSASVRSVRTAINLSTKARPLHTIGITSAMPKEGKTTFLCNLAALHAMSNMRVLIVDADVHNPTLSRILAPDRKLGLVEALQGTSDVGSCIVERGGTKPDILPLAGTRQTFDSAELLGSEAMRRLIDILSKHYDLILFDLPPLKPVVDGLAVCPLLDAVILVAEWGSSPVPLLAEVLHELRRASASPLGIVLTKVDERAEEGYRGGSPYRSRSRDYVLDA